MQIVEGVLGRVKVIKGGPLGRPPSGVGFKVLFRGSMTSSAWLSRDGTEGHGWRGKKRRGKLSFQRHVVSKSLDLNGTEGQDNSPPGPKSERTDL